MTEGCTQVLDSSLTICYLPYCHIKFLSVSSKGKKAMSGNGSRVKKERKECQAPLAGNKS